MKKLMITLLGAAICCAQTLFADDAPQVVQVTPENPVTLNAGNVGEYAGKRFEFAGGTFDLNGQSISIVSISGTDASALITNSAAETVTLTLTEAESATGFVGAIASSVTIAKTGGSQTSLDVTDAGSINVTSGTLLFPSLVDISVWAAVERAFDVTGAMVEFSQGLLDANAAALTVSAEESASLVFKGTSELSSQSYALADSTLHLKGRINMSGTAALEMKGGEWKSDSGCPFWMKGGTAMVENVMAQLNGDLAVDGQTMVLKNVSGKFSNIVVGSRYGIGELVIDGGGITNNGGLVIANQKDGTLTFKGGRHKFNVSQIPTNNEMMNGVWASPFDVATSSAYTGTINVEGEDTEVTISGDGTYIGGAGNANLTIKSGSFVAGSGYWAVGSSRTTKIRISSGYLQLGNMDSGNASSVRGTLDYEQTGGAFNSYTIRVKNSKSRFRLVDGVVTNTTLAIGKGAALVLDGGVLSTGNVLCDNYNGSFSANGGCIKTRWGDWWDHSNPSSNSDLLKGFPKGELGEKGLTVDTADGKAPIRQHLTLAEGATRAVLVKKGGNELRLLQDAAHPGPIWDFAGGVEVRGGTFTAMTGTISESVAAGGAEVKVLKNATFTCYDTLTNAVLSGGGTVNANGGLESPVLFVPVAADGSIASTNQLTVTANVTGKIVVDFGRTADNPLPLKQMGAAKVATKWTGTLPDTSSWEVKGTGYAHTRSKFEVSAEGAISVRIREAKGLILMLR